MSLDRKGGYLYFGDFRTAFPQGAYVARQGEVWKGKDGKPDCYPIIIADQDGKVFKFSVENDTVGRQLAALPQDEWFFMSAVGAKQTACLDLKDAEGNPVTAPVSSAPSRPVIPLPTQTSPIQRPAQSAPAAISQSIVPDDIATVVRSALNAAGTLVEAFEQQFGREMTENDRALAITMLIQFFQQNGKVPIDRNGWIEE